MKNKFKRSRLFVDAKVQGALVLRTFAYWWMCLLILTIWLVGWRVLNEPADLFSAHLAAVWNQFGPAAIASFLLLPIVLVDIIRLSNRFAGPMYRMRREIRNLVKGDPVEGIRLRDGDFWQDFATDLSQVIARYQELQRAAHGTTTPHVEKNAPPTKDTVGATAV